MFSLQAIMPRALLQNDEHMFLDA